MSIADLPYEILVRIAGNLDMTAIRSFSLAASTKDNLLFLNDERLFRELCNRDFDYHDEKPWSWKESYRSLTVFSNYMLRRCKEIYENDVQSMMRPTIPEEKVLTKYFRDEVYQNSDDEEEDNEIYNNPMNGDNKYFRTNSESCVQDIDHKPVFITELRDDEDMSFHKLVDLRNMRFQHEMVIESLRVTFMDNEDRMDPNDGFFAPGRQNLAILKEGLCKWLRIEKREDCGYVLLCPIEQAVKLFHRCHNVYRDRQDREKSEIYRLLKRRLIATYSFSNPQLALKNAEPVWNKICYEMQKRKLEIVSSELLRAGTVDTSLRLILVRKPRWTTLKTCMVDNCNRELPEAYTYDLIASDSDTNLIRIQNCCEEHRNSLYPMQVTRLMELRCGQLLQEQRVYVARIVRSPMYGCNPKEEFSIAVIDDNIKYTVGIGMTSFIPECNLIPF